MVVVAVGHGTMDVGAEGVQLAVRLTEPLLTLERYQHGPGRAAVWPASPRHTASGRSRPL